MKNKNNNNKKTNTNTNSSRKKKKCKHTHTLVYESACTHTNAYACMPECTYACMHAHTHTCMHTHTHTWTHTHMSKDNIWTSKGISNSWMFIRTSKWCYQYHYHSISIPDPASVGSRSGSQPASHSDVNEINNPLLFNYQKHICTVMLQWSTGNPCCIMINMKLSLPSIYTIKAIWGNVHIFCVWTKRSVPTKKKKKIQKGVKEKHLIRNDLSIVLFLVSLHYSQCLFGASGYIYFFNHSSSWHFCFTCQLHFLLNTTLANLWSVNATAGKRAFA